MNIGRNNSKTPLKYICNLYEYEFSPIDRILPNTH